MLLTGTRAWGAVAALAIDQLVAWGVLHYAYSVLCAPIAADLGISRLVVAMAFSWCLLVGGAVSKRLGPLLDRYGAGGVLRVGAIAAPCGFVSLALARDPTSLFVAFTVLGVAQALALHEPAFRAIVDWFPDSSRRARALLVVTAVGGLASTVFLPITTWLVGHPGWRSAVLWLAGFLALTLVPLRFALPHARCRHPPAPPAPFRPPPSADHLAAALALHALAATGVFVGLLWHLVERGASPAAAAATTGLAGGAQVVGRLFVAPLRAAIGSGRLLPCLLVAQSAALVGVVGLDGAIATACTLVFGVASGTVTIERATIVSEWYGTARFGAHQGRLAGATQVARAAAPFVVEAGHRLVPYAAVFALFAATLLLSAWLGVSAGRRRAIERAAAVATSG